VLLRRAVPILVLVALLATPVAAWAQPAGRGPSHDGALVILGGKGAVDLHANGSGFGKVRKGKLKIKISKGKHGSGAHGHVVVHMRGKGSVRHKQGGVVVYKGRNIRFWIVNKRFRVQINGVGINLSFGAQGTCTLQASQTASNPGVFQVNGGSYQPLPEFPTTYQLSS
jgi:hypothetical protein